MKIQSLNKIFLFVRDSVVPKNYFQNLEYLGKNTPDSDIYFETLSMTKIL